MKRALVITIILLLFSFDSAYALELPTIGDNYSSFSVTYLANEENYDDVTEYQGMDNFCEKFANGIRVGGYLLVLAKVAIPLIIIVLSSFRLFQAILKGETAELNAWIKKLAVSVTAGILIFLLPTIVDLVFGLVIDEDENGTVQSDIAICEACLLTPTDDSCSKYADNTGLGGE